MTRTIETLNDIDGDQAAFIHYDAAAPGGGTYVQVAAEREVISAGPFKLDELRAALDAVAPHGSYTRHESPDDADGAVAAARTEKEAGCVCCRPLAGEARFLHDQWAEARVRAAKAASMLAPVQHQRDDARCMARLWKETARRLSQERRDYRRDAQFEEARADRLAAAYHSGDEQRVKAELARRGAEHRAKENAATIKEQAALIEALRAERPQMEGNGGRYNFLVMSDGNAYQHVDDIKPRPLDPGEVPDSMLLAMLNALGTREPGKTVGQHPALLLERLRRGISAVLAIDATRPEGAEELDPHVDASLRGAGLNPLSAAELRTVADNLASEGVRAQGDGS